MKQGDRVRFSTTMSNGSTVTYTAKVVRVDNDGTCWVEFPSRVRTMPFAPLGGKRYGQFRISDLVKESN